MKLQPQQADPAQPKCRYFKINRSGRGTKLGGKTGQTEQGWTKFSERAEVKRKASTGKIWKEKENWTRSSKTKSCNGSQRSNDLLTEEGERRTGEKKSQSSLTPGKQQKGGKLRKVDLSIKSQEILDTFQSRDLAPGEWDILADQVLKRGIQKVADELRVVNQSVGERDEQFDPPTGASDYSSMEDTGVRSSSWQTKSKESQLFGDPFKHSIR